MTDAAAQEKREITKEVIENYGGVVMLGELPQTFPFSSEEVFSQVASGNMLRIEDGKFCWKKSPFEMKGYVGRLGKVLIDRYAVHTVITPNVMDIIEGRTIDIKVFEKNGKRIETYLRVLHQMNAHGENIGSYHVEFKFDNGGASVNYDVVYEDGVQTQNGISVFKIEKSTTSSCFGKKRTSKKQNSGGLRLIEHIPENLLIEGIN